MKFSSSLFGLLVILCLALIFTAFFGPDHMAVVSTPARLALGSACITALIALIVERPKRIIEHVRTTEYLLGSLEPVTVYESYEGSGYNICRAGYYSSYELAFRTNPKLSVRPIQLYKVGDKYIHDITTRLVDIQLDHDVKEPTA